MLVNARAFRRVQLQHLKILLVQLVRNCTRMPCNYCLIICCNVQLLGWWDSYYQFSFICPSLNQPRIKINMISSLIFFIGVQKSKQCCFKFQSSLFSIQITAQFENSLRYTDLKCHRHLFVPTEQTVSR